MLELSVAGFSGFLLAQGKQETLHEHVVHRSREVVVILAVKETHFPDGITDLICRPDGLLSRTKQIVRRHEHVDRNLAYCIDWHVIGYSVSVVFHVLRSILLEALFYSILEHVF